MWHSIDYVGFDLAPDSVFPAGRHVRRPVLRLDLVNGTNRFPCYAIVDSGADNCIFPLSFATALGLDTLSTLPVNTAGVGNSAVPTFYWNVVLDFPGALTIPTIAGFTDGLNAIGFGLLGQMGFLDKVNVLLNYRSGKFHIEIDDPPQASQASG